MLKLIDGFMPKVWPWLALGLAVLVLLQQLRVAGLQVDVATLEASHAKAGQEQAQQAQAAIKKDASTLLQHAGNQQDNTHAYTQEIQRLEAGRTTDAARIASLQHNLRTTATQHAQAASNAAACRDLADQHQQLATHAAQGAGVVGELVALVQQRDAQVNALKGQVRTDRQLLD
jgi:chromosome segregation ATPase